MSGLVLAVLLAAAAAAVLDWAAVARGSRPVEYLAKPLTTSLLVVVAVLLDPVEPAQQAWFVAALVASLGGDVLLMVPAPGPDPAGDAAALPAAFAAGLAAFLLAQVAYAIGFVVGGVTGIGIGVGLVVMAVAGATVGRTIVRAGARLGEPVVTVALVAYLLAIGAMVVTAFGSGRPLAAGGATLFLASDAILGWNRFVRPLPWAPLAVMVTYHLGQAGLVLSLQGW